MAWGFGATGSMPPSQSNGATIGRASTTSFAWFLRPLQAICCTTWSRTYRLLSLEELPRSDLIPGCKNNVVLLLDKDQRHAKLSTAAVFLKMLHDLAVQKRGYVDLQGAADADNGPCCYGNTLSKHSSCTVPSTWAMTDPTNFLIRGETYLHDRQKVLGTDWLNVYLNKYRVELDSSSKPLLDGIAGNSGGKRMAGSNICAESKTLLWSNTF